MLPSGAFYAVVGHLYLSSLFPFFQSFVLSVPLNVERVLSILNLLFPAKTERPHEEMRLPEFLQHVKVCPNYHITKYIKTMITKQHRCIYIYIKKERKKEKRRKKHYFFKKSVTHLIDCSKMSGNLFENLKIEVAMKE